MDFDQLTDEQKAQTRVCKTAEEVVRLAQEAGSHAAPPFRAGGPIPFLPRAIVRSGQLREQVLDT